MLFLVQIILGFMSSGSAEQRQSANLLDVQNVYGVTACFRTMKYNRLEVRWSINGPLAGCRHANMSTPAMFVESPARKVDNANLQGGSIASRFRINDRKRGA